VILHTGRWKRRAAVGPWPNTTGFAGYHADVAYFMAKNEAFRSLSRRAERRCPQPSPTIESRSQLSLAVMGVSIFDNLDFEERREARRLNRYEFLFMAARSDRQGNRIAAQSAGGFLNTGGRD
jgi:hypothetical protein